MTTTLRFLFVSNPHIVSLQHEYPLNTSTKDAKKRLYDEWPSELDKCEYSSIRMIVGGQKMDDVKQLSEYPVCTPGSAPAVHVTVLPSSSQRSQDQRSKSSACCTVQ